MLCMGMAKMLSFWLHVDILKVNPSRNKQPSLLGPSPWALCALQVPFAVQASGPLLWFHFGVFFIPETQHCVGEARPLCRRLRGRGCANCQSCGEWLLFDDY